MPRPRDSGQPPKVSAKDAWINEFVIELRRHRGELGLKHAHRIALQEWFGSQAMPPDAAALRWVADQEARRKQ